MKPEVSKEGVESNERTAFELATFEGRCLGGHKPGEELVSVFIASGDESKPRTERETTHCVYGGFLASKENWDLFIPQWMSNVLESGPKIDYFHMTDLRDPRRYPNGISAAQAEEKIIAAYQTIGKAKYLRPVMVSFGNAPFAHQLKGTKFKRPERAAAQVKPEHLGFYRFVKVAADCAHLLEPNSKYVDIMFENSVAKGDPESRNSSVVRDFQDIFECAKKQLFDSGERVMASRLRDCYPGSKKRPALQAADCSAWLCRHLYNRKRFGFGTIDPLDERYAANWDHKGRDVWIPDDKNVVLWVAELVRSAETRAREVQGMR